jgi:hypothetical protein
VPLGEDEAHGTVASSPSAAESSSEAEIGDGELGAEAVVGIGRMLGRPCVKPVEDMAVPEARRL